MPSASDADREAAAPREPDCHDDVRDAAAARDQRREAIDRAVPDPALLVVSRIEGLTSSPVNRALSSLRSVRSTAMSVAMARTYAGRPQHCRSVKVVPQRPGS